jgi:hypothetical protein
VTGTARAVRFDRYGGREVLYVADVPMPVPAAGEVVVAVRAAGINPGEASIRKGLLHEQFPATFPSGQGSDLAGVVTAVGDGVDSGCRATRCWASRGSAPVRPPTWPSRPTSWSASRPSSAGRWPARCTSWAARRIAAVRAVGAGPGDTVAVSAAAGGVGSIVVQLLGSGGPGPSASRRRPTPSGSPPTGRSPWPTATAWPTGCASGRTGRHRRLHRPVRTGVRPVGRRPRHQPGPDRDHHLVGEGRRDRGQGRGQRHGLHPEVLTEMAGTGGLGSHRGPHRRHLPARAGGRGLRGCWSSATPGGRSSSSPDVRPGPSGAGRTARRSGRCGVPTPSESSMHEGMHDPGTRAILDAERQVASDRVQTMTIGARRAGRRLRGCQWRRRARSRGIDAGLRAGPGRSATGRGRVHPRGSRPGRGQAGGRHLRGVRGLPGDDPTRPARRPARRSDLHRLRHGNPDPVDGPVHRHRHRPRDRARRPRGPRRRWVVSPVEPVARPQRRPPKMRSRAR